MRDYSEFFWLPFDTITWLRRVVPDLGLWMALRTIRDDNDAELIRVEDLRPEMFESEREEPIQLYLGSSEALSPPVWGHVGRRRELDNEKSYSIQFVPSTFSPGQNALSLGRMAILRLSYYEDHDRATRLAALFRRLQAMAREHSDRSQGIVQILSTGGIKRWNHMLVGKSLRNTSGVHLRQFFDVDDVVFEARSL
jgi:hypothetical protein